MNAKTPPTFSPRDNLEQVFRFWWVIAVLGILGGLLGWVVHNFQSPIYISSTEFSVTLDLARTGPLEERDHDRLILAFGGVFYAQDIIDETLRQASELGIEMDTATFLEIVYQEWRIAAWEYSVRHPDPEVAQTIAAIWANVASERVAAALVKAQEAQSTQDYIDAILTCKDEINAAEDAPVVNCTLPEFEDVEQELAELNSKYTEALSQSRSLTPSLSFEQIKEANLPLQPSTSGRALAVFFGALTGMLVGVWVVNQPRLQNYINKS